jgi:hypothetical protein
MNKSKLKEIKSFLLLKMINEEEKNSEDLLMSNNVANISLAVLFSTIIGLLAFVGSPYGILNALIVLCFYVFVMFSVVFMLQENVKYVIEVKAKILSLDHLSLPFNQQHPSFTGYFSKIMKDTIFDNNELTDIIKSIKQNVSEEDFKNAIYNKEVVNVKNEYGVGSLFYICHLIDTLCYGKEKDIVESEKGDVQNKYMVDKFKNALKEFSAKIVLTNEHEITDDLLREINNINSEGVRINIENQKGVIVLHCSFKSRIYEEGLSELLGQIGKSKRFFNKLKVV